MLLFCSFVQMSLVSLLGPPDHVRVGFLVLLLLKTRVSRCLSGDLTFVRAYVVKSALFYFREERTQLRYKPLRV
jgi:hypothetical protein